MLLSGCGDSAPSLLAVKAVAAGVASVAPFFDEGERLGRDEPRLTPLEPHSGLQQGNAPGLYGGTQKPKVCDVRKLEDFLTAPENKNKAQEWARITGVDADGIGRYLDELTPVLLRHDTLVKNHDYKKGKAVPFDALLEAGIAVLVDDQGLPAVKCSCGNPLRAFDADPARVEVKFPGDRKWKGYDKSGMVVVEPAPGQLKEIKLVDVEDPGRGISREVGTTGESDTTFDTRARQAVPKVRGMTFDEASAAMADRGLAVTVAGEALPPGDTPVTGSSPGPGTELEFGAAVALAVDRPGGTAEANSGDSEPASGSRSGSGSGSETDSGAGAGPSDSGSSTGSSTGSGSGAARSGPTEPSRTGDSSTGGSPSESGSTPTDGNTTPSGGGPPSSGGGSSGGGSAGGGSAGTGSTDGGASPPESVAPPATGGTTLVPSPSTPSERAVPEPDPPPSPSAPSSAPVPSTSSGTPPPPEPEPEPDPDPDPDPIPPQDSDPPPDGPTTSDPEPLGGAPAPAGGPGDPGDPGLPLDDPAQLPVRI
ncbi:MULTISPECIES: PASTA domain-containing protein [Streptomyces]|uniref:Lipoprotein n=1 Tax=Streptomyces bottropensis ATCC 25435 TaxID=1054862 RepID=M3DN87_9ACTN|nr:MULTISPECIES: PASTA domain-containing protein [Streptomyces]EMF58452.1 lipoprotein [Streptomyces bottropensis ATCC 25435]MZD18909.1 PASTA domain-containing protein [Streptomyces sp. SID5476]